MFEHSLWSWCDPGGRDGPRKHEVQESRGVYRQKSNETTSHEGKLTNLTLNKQELFEQCNLDFISLQKKFQCFFFNHKYSTNDA